MGIALDCLTAIANLFLVSLGLFLVYGLLRVINLAHGELVMVGAYTSALVQQAGGGYAIGLTTAVVLAAGLGFAIELLIIRRLYDRHNLSTLLATWGVSLCLCETVRLACGPAGRYVEPPTETVLWLFGTPYPLYSLFTILAALLVATVCWLVLYATSFGLLVRAVMEDPVQAEACGINTRRIYQCTFAAGAALAGMAGAIIAPITAVTPYMGTDWSASAFLVVIIGGSASLAAPIAGVAVVGGVRSILNSLFGITPATVGMLLIAMLILIFRPEGLLNRPGTSTS